MTAPSHLTILWRGHLSGCNYDCHYCPFGKTADTRENLEADRIALEKFTGWVSERDYDVSILFTPWGEGLIRNYYREAMRKLSHMTDVRTVAIQTNLSCSVEWIETCNTDSIAFWATYHPTETDRASFLTRIAKLSDMDIRHSVGVVATRESFDEIERLRSDLPDSTYLWINAEEDIKGHYDPLEIDRLSRIDPLFELNNIDYPSKDRACATGHTSISVLADGTARRCHFIPTPIGNIYDATFEESLTERPCANKICNCHIGYSHMPDLGFSTLYADGMIERRANRPSRADARIRIANFKSKTL